MIFLIFLQKLFIILTYVMIMIRKIWQYSLNKLDVEEKREILNKFYATKSSTEIKTIFEVIDIQSTLNDSSPYIFDYDYIEYYDMIEKKKKKKKKKR